MFLTPQIKRLALYAALIMTIMMLFKHRYPSVNFTVALALLALALQHL